MTGPLYRIGRVCSRHHWPVVIAWVAAALALVLVASAAGDRNSDRVLPRISVEGEGYFEALEAKRAS